MRTARRSRIAVDSEGDRAPAVPPASRLDEADSLTSGSMKDMAEEEKPKEEPKQDSGKSIKNGGYTIPVQMY
jgi:hypothetical protein